MSSRLDHALSGFSNAEQRTEDEVAVATEALGNGDTLIRRHESVVRRAPAHSAPALDQNGSQVGRASGN